MSAGAVTVKAALRMSVSLRQVGQVDPSLVVEQLLTILTSEYGLEGFDVRHQWVSSNTRSVLELESPAGEKLAVKIDTAVESATIWGAYTQDWVAGRASGLAPTIRKTKAAALAVRFDGGRIVVSDWISGTSPRAPEDWWQVGAALARLHQIELTDRSFGVPFAAAVHELMRDFAGDPWTVAAEPLIARIAGLPLTPLAIIHGEPAASNLKITAAGATLLDWDQAGVGAVVLDLGFPLIHEFVSPDLGFRGRSRGVLLGVPIGGGRSSEFASRCLYCWLVLGHALHGLPRSRRAVASRRIRGRQQA